jgi:hypothetical protein
VTDRPIRVFHGTADDLAPIERCRAYVERLRQAGAAHAFDRPGDGPPRHNPHEQNASRCFWEERPDGHLVSRSTGQPFGLSDPCVTLGGTNGPDPTAYREALRAVKALVGPGARPGPEPGRRSSCDDPEDHKLLG